MIKPYYIYEEASGRILRSVSCPAADIESQCEDGESSGAGAADSRAQYVVGGVLTGRPSMPFVVSGATITGVPAGTQYAVTNASLALTDGGVCDDGEITLTGFDPSTYTVSLDCFPYAWSQVEIAVT